MVLAGTMLFLSDIAYAKSRTQDSVPGYKPDTGYFAKRFIHRLGVEYRPGYIFPTSSFLAGDNSQWKPFEWGYSAHLKYSFQFKPNTCADRIYGSAYQGIGVGYYDLGSKEELGTRLPFTSIKERALRVSLNGCHSITNGTSVCPSAGNLMTNATTRTTV